MFSSSPMRWQLLGGITAPLLPVPRIRYSKFRARAPCCGPVAALTPGHDLFTRRPCGMDSCPSFLLFGSVFHSKEKTDAAQHGSQRRSLALGRSVVLRERITDLRWDKARGGGSRGRRAAGGVLFKSKQPLNAIQVPFGVSELCSCLPAE